MPPTITFVLGLCGSGKSTYVRQRPDRLAFDEGVVPGLPNYEAFLDAVASGRDCIVIDVLYLVERARRDARDLILSYHPDATIRWVCFENDLAKANRNCNERARRDPASFPEEKRLGDLAHNAEWTRLYCSPDPSIHGDQNIEFLPIRHADS